MDVMSHTFPEVLRARALTGRVLTLSQAEDRLPIDRRPRDVACPTCDDGVLTVTYPRRCIAYVAEGF